MKKRNLLAVFFLPLLTFGIYEIVWHVKTKGELVRSGGDVPTAWLIIVPIANLYWLFKYYKAAGEVSGGRIKGMFLFAFSLLLGLASSWINIGINVASDPPPLAYAVLGALSLVHLGVLVYLQSHYNKLATA